MQGATDGWMILYSSGFLCVSSHYLILPRVSSLVVEGLRVSAPTLKAQGLTSSCPSSSESLSSFIALFLTCHLALVLFTSFCFS